MLRALLESLRQPARAAQAREQAEQAQMGQDGMYTMGKDIFGRLDELSQENRHKLHEQIKRVQAEAKQLRAQARQLNRARHAEAKKRKKLLEQLARSGQTLKSSMWQRGEDAAAQLKASQRAALERQNRLADTFSQYGDQARQNLSGWRAGAAQMLGDWRESAAHSLEDLRGTSSQTVSDWRESALHNLDDWRAGASQKMAGLRGQGVSISHNGRGKGVTASLRKQRRQLGYGASDLRDDTAHILRRQGQHMLQNMADWKDEAAYQLHKQQRQLAHKLADRREDAAHALHKQKRTMGRNVLERRDEMTRQLRKQGRSLGRNIDERKGGIWPLLGFLFGVLLAGGITYWFIKNNTRRQEMAEEEQIELQEREILNGTSSRPSGEIRYVSPGGTAVATRTSATPINKFVGVLSTRQYYPIARKPQAHDLVFFETEDDARAEGFTEAD